MELAGFGNYHQSEAIPGALPQEQNSPQPSPYRLYAEQLSGSAFTRQRHVNLHSWLYRTLPSVVHHDYVLYHQRKRGKFVKQQAPNPYRWSPLTPPHDTVDFVDGLFHLAGNNLVNAFVYQCTTSMHTRYFTNNDGEMLFVPYSGELLLFTEFGPLTLSPGKIAVIPRGVTFKVILASKEASGYIAENQGLPLKLPELGVIGANGLANPRHFLYPQASFENNKHPVTLLCKFQQTLWTAKSNHSPLNVIAWHGNYAPYFYDLSLFNTINSVSFDHPDPSIFTVLTSESPYQGIANLDFVIFPPHWVVAEHTFRPPYYHKNVMNELMGLISGQYAGKETDFLPGGVSIHNGMTAHGPDSVTYLKRSQEEQKPMYYRNMLAFMFETRKPWRITEAALHHPSRQQDYSNCWQDLEIADVSTVL